MIWHVFEKDFTTIDGKKIPKGSCLYETAGGDGWLAWKENRIVQVFQDRNAPKKINDRQPKTLRRYETI
jgi:hypothetical protein